MSSSKINVDQLATTVEATLARYAGVVVTDLRESVAETGKETLADIRSRALAYGWHNHAKTWKVKSEPPGRLTSGGKAIVYADDPGYRVAHLLERSHPLRNGGRSRAFPYIKPAEEKAEERLLRLLRQKIGGA